VVAETMTKAGLWLVPLSYDGTVGNPALHGIDSFFPTLIHDPNLDGATLQIELDLLVDPAPGIRW